MVKLPETPQRWWRGLKHKQKVWQYQVLFAECERLVLAGYDGYGAQWVKGKAMVRKLIAAPQEKGVFPDIVMRWTEYDVYVIKQLVLEMDRRENREKRLLAARQLQEISVSPDQSDPQALAQAAD